MSNETILVVDDDPAILQLFGNTLRTKGYKLLEANHALKAYEIVDQHKPHLIILDYMMPDINGIEACRQLRTRPELEETYIIMCTAYAERAAKVECLLAGADSYLTKPVSPVDLVAQVQALLHRPRKITA